MGCSPRSTACRAGSVEGMLGLAIGFAPMLLMLLLGGYHYKRLALLTAQFGEWLWDKGSLGMLIYLVAFTFYLVMCGPSTPLELVGGFVYPLTWAIFLNGTAKLCGSVLCFLIARRFGACARQLMSGGSKEAAAGVSLPPALAMIDSMLVTHEFRALVLFRFAVLPFSVKNYGLGAMPSVRLYSFAVTCALGDFPFTVAFAYAGRSVQSLVEVAEGRESAMGGRGSLLVMLLSVGGTFAMVLLISWHARATMDKAQAQSEKFMSPADPEAGGGLTIDLATQHSTRAGAPAAGGAKRSIAQQFEMPGVTA